MMLIDIAKGLEHDLSLFSETKIAELEFRVVMKEREKDSFAPSSIKDVIQNKRSLLGLP